MFCTQCGTPFELGQNFCKHCGARVSQQPDLIAPTEAFKRDATKIAPVSKTSNDARPLSRSPDREGISMSVIGGACLALILVGSAVIYFVTDLFRQPAKQETAVVADVPASTGTNLPDTRRREEEKNSNRPVHDNLSSARHSQEAQTPLPVPADSLQPRAEDLAKPAPKTDGTESTRKSQSPRAGQDGQATGGATKTPTSAAASRRGGTAGTYQTTRSTTVFESPSASSQVVANIPGGTRVSVVSANGQWLEVHSRRGNPPGFIRREDATFVEKAE